VWLISWPQTQHRAVIFRGRYWPFGTCWVFSDSWFQVWFFFIISLREGLEVEVVRVLLGPYIKPRHIHNNSLTLEGPLVFFYSIYLNQQNNIEPYQFQNIYSITFSKIIFLICSFWDRVSFFKIVFWNQGCGYGPFLAGSGCRSSKSEF